MKTANRTLWTPGRCLFANLGLFASAFALILSGVGAGAQTVNLAKAPLLTQKTAPGLVLLTMGRDLPLFKAAYNDVNDLDGDNIPDLFFKPSFRYEGYFAHNRCYSYASSVFSTVDVAPTTVIPDAADTSKNYYKCPGRWSGNFLNWVAMSRMDVLRKVLYGGKRSTDTTSTVLERAFVPQDSTMWGKEYLSFANDGYDIRDYTPLALPTGATRHMFANTTLQNANPGNQSTRFTPTVNNPLMIVYQNRPGRIWDLVSAERLILGPNPGVNPLASVLEGTVITQYVVRVKVCDTSTNTNAPREDFCTGYPTSSASPTSYKPTGLLHKYGEDKSLAFGLLSGTYDNNYAGGVLRQNVDDFNQEVTPSNGRFTSVKGVVHHLNAFRPWGFGSASDDWGCVSFASLATNGLCVSWGNPLGEMMFEGLKYFSGGTSSPAFTANVGTAANSPEPVLSLQQPAWINPYAASASRANTAAYPTCARPLQMTIGDPKTSFDSDHLPGSSFAVGTGMGSTAIPTLGSLNVSTEADAIWATEFGAGVSKKFFIGEGGGVPDGNPSAKTVSSFKAMRGHAPDATTNQGSFYGASVARFGKFSGVTNTQVTGPLRVDQVSIALDSHIPQIKIPLGGKTITIVPMSKSVNDLGISRARGSYQQTGAITAFFVDQMANTNTTNVNATVNGGRPYYKFRVSFSDTDQGNDNESDAKLTYEIKVTAAGKLAVGMDYFNGTNGIEMHQGYVISGTTADGTYLDVAGGPGFGVPPAPNVGYYLDTMPGTLPGSAMAAPATGPAYTNIATRLPRSTLAAPREFSVGATANGEFVPHDMLWYAAKYGGAVRDTSGGFNYSFKPNGEPENYFLANNPSQLSTQMGQAFQKAASLSAATSSAVAGNGVRVGAGSFVYQADYDTIKWGGDLNGYDVDANGNVANTPTWKVTTSMPTLAARQIVLGRGGSSSTSISLTSYSSLSAAEKTAFKDDTTFRYLLGERTGEQSVGGNMRNRSSAVGDIVNSDPLYVNSADFGYSFDASYAAFKGTSAPQLVGIGSNDGFYRLVSANTGVEQLAFIPLGVRDQMSKLANPGYNHQYYVDGPSSFGHVKFSGGSWNSVIVGSLGAGGKSLFAINASATTTSTKVLWEFTGTDVGNVTNKPIIGMLENGTTPVAIVGNGLNSATGKAALLVLNAETGALIRSCLPTDAANTLGNGLGSVAFVSTAGNGKISFVYGADYKGNIWRFDPNFAGCGVDKVFTARNASNQIQPITGELTIIAAPPGKAGYMVLFGTGSYLTVSDPSNIDIQSLYGVWDDLGSTTKTRANLALQTIVTPSTLAGARTTSTTTVNGAWFDPPNTLKGWYLDLTCTDSFSPQTCLPGERLVSKPTLLGSGANLRAFFLSMVPGTDPCQVGGGGWVTAIDPYSGGYYRGFETLTQNSTYVAGVTPRGLFLVQRTPTATNTTTDILFVSVTISGGAIPNPRGTVSSGGMRTSADGSGTGVIGLGVTCTGAGCPPPPACVGPTCPPLTPITTGIGTRRQVWRQIQ